LSSSGHSRLIRAANQEHLAMVGIIKMRLLQLSDQSK